MKDSTKNVIKFLQANADADMTAIDVVMGMGLAGDDVNSDEFKKEVKRVNGVFSASLQRKGYGYREEAQVEVANEDGKSKYANVKFLKLTDAGINLDVDAEPEKAE